MTMRKSTPIFKTGHLIIERISIKREMPVISDLIIRKLNLFAQPEALLSPIAIFIGKTQHAATYIVFLKSPLSSKKYCPVNC
ncbi:hypothetical protein, partial [Bartonella sp. MR168JLCBS]|uniref:hypothetical protein n=1 Tax=Bartonella sp. MR168JLCBS TaxID=3243556 RepID=UPI0035CFA75A